MSIVKKGIEMELDLKILLPEIKTIAKNAAKKINEIYVEADHGVQYKKDDSPLTRADLEANDYIVAALKTLTPDIPVISEETELAKFSERKTWSYYWLVDPLDGTRGFVDRVDEFTVNIALIHQHQSVLGVIVLPVSGHCYSGLVGDGAYVESDSEAITQIQSRKSVVGALTILTGRSSNRSADLFSKVCEFDIERMHSSSKFCLIAAGKADIYPRLGPTSEWDTAAADAILTAAGGAIVELSGKPLQYNTKDSIINPEFIAFGDPSVIEDTVEKLKNVI